MCTPRAHACTDGHMHSVVNFSPTLSALLQGASDVSILGNLTQVCYRVFGSC